MFAEEVTAAPTTVRSRRRQGGGASRVRLEAACEARASRQVEQLVSLFVMTRHTSALSLFVITPRAATRLLTGHTQDTSVCHTLFSSKQQ